VCQAFCPYSGAEAGRDYNTVDMSRINMYNYYFAPYKAAAEEGAGSYMSSFNVVDGIPATGNKWLLTDVLRDQWNFDGFVVTDYGAIEEMQTHGLGDLQQVSELALKAGIDMDMMSSGFIGTLEQSFKEGKVSETEINPACRRILEAKYKLGLFDNPYKYSNSERAKSQIYTLEHRRVARNIAVKSFVLLKNENRILPLEKKGTIALIGPLADTKNNIYGCWAGTAVPEKYKSLREAMASTFGEDVRLLYAKGSNMCYDETIELNCTHGLSNRDSRSPQEMIVEALRVANQADVIIFAGGEIANCSGEGASRSDIAIYDAQLDLLKALKKTGKSIVMLNFAGRSTVMNWEYENIPAILNVWFGGSEAGDAICDIVFGDKSPSGKLVTSMPKSVGQCPIYYNHLPTGRPQEQWFTKYRSAYLDIDNDPLFPFGYGLSYTTFDYGDIKLDTTQMTANEQIRATVTVSNTGNCDAEEIVQLYIHDPVASISRPVKELKGFQRISLKKGESKSVEFTITANLLKFYNNNLDFIAEPGEFEVMIGSNSRDTKSRTITLK
jgi:beta-glucosidase